MPTVSAAFINPYTMTTEELLSSATSQRRLTKLEAIEAIGDFPRILLCIKYVSGFSLCRAMALMSKAEGHGQGYLVHEAGAARCLSLLPDELRAAIVPT